MNQEPRRSPRRRTLFAAAVAAAFAVAVPAQAQAAEIFYGVSEGNRLVRFTSDRPADVRSRSVTGLPRGEVLVGLDRRPAGNALYGLGLSGRLYVITPSSGAALPVAAAPLQPAIAGTGFGVDFNPVPDRLRVVSDFEQNLRVNQLNGTVQVVDGSLAYAESDFGTGRNPTVTAIAYSNPFAGATSTELFGIDSGLNTLVRIDNPNAGGLVTVGPLGADPEGPVSFDIATNNVAYAAFRRRGGRLTGLYRVNPATGQAVRSARRYIIDVRGKLRGLTAVGQGR